ncbi:hypothetical protein [Nocardiopsis sp. CA-288880]|uniref:hypothetical protein n=1 Tax=Nocardiopsis sp. CA-288880 TaxID=3239995 RepID=UPI003D973EDA
MARLSKEASLLLRAILCVVVLGWLAVDVIVKWGGDEALVGGPVMTWWGGIMCSITLVFLVVEYRQLRLAKRAQEPAPPSEAEPTA